MISVIDIFAGPGGLGEGFSSLRKHANGIPFRVCLSIEKDRQAWETLRLRSFFREFPDGEAPDDYYEHLRGELSREDLYRSFPGESSRADAIAKNIELGSKEWPRANVSSDALCLKSKARLETASASLRQTPATKVKFLFSR